MSERDGEVASPYPIELLKKLEDIWEWKLNVNGQRSAIARTTPAILGLFSLVTLLAHHLQPRFTWTTRQKSWDVKSLPTFSDALALVRRFLWASTFSMSYNSADIIKVPRPLFDRLRDLAIYAA